MQIFLFILLLMVFSERIIKHLLVIRFFRVPNPPQHKPVRLVSILQPILSGDPTLAEGLEQNLCQRSRYPVEFLWLVDIDDQTAQSICQSLIETYPQKQIQLILLPPPGSRQNPKMIKLIAGSRAARGDVLCVLDDDTRLPDGSLDACLPHLDLPGAGLAFGLPYYVSFGNFWSRMVAYFVNSHSLMSYVPYAMITHPVTINGMFYTIRWEVLESIGGFTGLEHILADDFAIAQRVRAHGYRLVQTSVRHGISTWISSPRRYFNLIQRWFIFPRESMMRHLQGREKTFFYASTVLPVFFPWLAVITAILDPALWPVVGLYFVYDYLIFAHCNIAYLRQASPWANSYWVTLLTLLLPVQILAAMLAPQRIIWRGHVMRTEPGGGFQIVQRRKSE